jgi:hypothetical protein
MAAGGRVISWCGQDHTVAHPEIVDHATALPAFPWYERLALRAVRINQFLWLRPPVSHHSDPNAKPQ